MSHWETLNNDLLTWSKRYETDTEFAEARSTIIELAERRIYRELPSTQFNLIDTGNMTAGDPLFPKRTKLSASGTVQIQADGAWTALIQRPKSFCLEFWPVEASTAPPRYFGVYDDDHFIAVPTPDQNYSYRFHLREVGGFLNEANVDTNLSTYCPDLLLMAALKFACTFMKDERARGMQDDYEGQYQQMLMGYKMSEIEITTGDFQDQTPRSNNA